jgi:serine protease
VTAAENSSGTFAGCVPPGATHLDSSWHGTRVSGIIGALSNNSQGVSGMTWTPWILPVRALGKCGGFDSDILDAMAWAGGLHVNGVPDNPYPAKIENLSLGSEGGCPASYQTVITQLAARGVLVVAAAGNEGGPVGAPANCLGVAGVTGLRHAGTKVGFASLGTEIAVGAPGGNCVNITGGPCLFSIDTTSNAGTTTAGTHTYTNQTDFNVGTSFSAPIVSGIVGLMASVNGNLGAAQLLARLKEGATKPFPTDPTVPMCHVPTGPNDIQDSECNCSNDPLESNRTCGAGMADALGAVTSALRPIAAIAVPAVVAPGQPVALSAAGSAGSCNRTITSYSWTVQSGGGALTSPNTAATSINAPTPGNVVVVRITVTDNLGATDFADVTINPTTTSTQAPANAGNNACPADIARPPPVGVTVSPTSATLSAGNGIQTFTASVTNASNTTVTWLVNGIQGGNSTVGTVTAGGVYQAPANVPSPAVVTVSARSVEDPAKSASAQVTITAPSVSVTVAPSTASVQVGTTLTLTATVSGTSNTAVSWRVDGADGGNATVGTISAFGIYTAPATVPSPATVAVTAVSVANTAVTSSAQVTVTTLAVPSGGGASGGSGGGGGGAALDLLALLCMLTFAVRLAPVRKIAPSR